MKKRFIRATLAGATGVALATALPASAVDRRVVGAEAAAVCDRAASVTGRDAGAGTVARPFRTVNRLVGSLRPGQSGCLLGGTFVENVVVRRGGSPGRPITLRSAPGTHATLYGILDISRSANDVVIANLRLNGKNSRGRPSPQVNGDRVTFRNNEITNEHTAICLLLGPGFEEYGRAAGVVVVGNRIHDCGRLPATGHDHGIYVEGTVGARIYRNFIYDNADYGIHLYPDANGSDIAYNVIDGNGGGVIFAGERGGNEYRRSYASSNNVVRNNVISNSTARPNVESWWGGPVGTGNVLRSNCLWNTQRPNLSTTRGGFTTSGNVNAKPLFRNRARGDLRLKRGTRCARIVSPPKPRSS